MNNKVLNDEKIFIKLLKKLERIQRELQIPSSIEIIASAMVCFQKGDNGTAGCLIGDLAIQLGMERNADTIIRFCIDNPERVHELIYPITIRAFKRRNP